MAHVDIPALRNTLEKWAERAITQGASAVYLFGSLIHKGGAQFTDSSDIDLVVVMPDLKDAASRSRWLEGFAELKDELEISLFRLLRRSGREPIVSVVAVTGEELAFDVHKDGHRAFFTENVFFDLFKKENAQGIAGAGIKEVDRFVAASLSFVQKVRNEYLATSANGTLTLDAYTGEDPLPKRVMRAAAMAARAIGASDGAGSEHDVQEGLDLLTNKLYQIRNEAPVYSNLQDIVSVRRRARGTHKDIDPAHQLLLAEIVYDVVSGLSSTAPSGAGTLTGASNPGRAEVNAEASTATGEDAEQLSATAPVATYASSTALFAERFMSAFPGEREIAWYTDAGDIEDRMMRLLVEPLTFNRGHPIWWWRGGNLQIESFSKIGEHNFLLNADELRISRVAAVPGSSYHRCFVYVRAEAMEPTGLYPINDAAQAEWVAKHGYDFEEFGLVDGTTPITRANYDDGATQIGGRIVDISRRAVLRVRYLTPYNFVIAAHGSPINNTAFDARLVEMLNSALRGDENAALAKLASEVEKLPLRNGQVL